MARKPRPEPNPRDVELVERLLDATRNMSLREKERATGIGRTTWVRFQHPGGGPDEGFRELHGSTREKIERYLSNRNLIATREPLSDPERARLLVLVEEMARILRGDGR